MISVIMTVYNGELYILKSLRSILSQSYADFELIIVNDGSTDNTLLEIQEIKDNRIQVINSTHIGRGPALNLGIEQARGNIIALQDADDISLPDRLQKQYQFLSTQAHNTIISCWYAVFYKDSIQYVIASPLDSKTVKKKLALTCHFPNAGLMCYKDFFIQQGLYRDIKYGLEDYEFFLRMKDNAIFNVLPEVLLFYRLTLKSLSSRNLTERYRLQYNLQTSYYQNLEKEFGIENREENLYRGWREYFYGSKLEARKYWMKLGFSVIHHPRIILAWCVTLLPEELFVRFKELRLKFRIQYYLKYFTKESCSIRKAFLQLVEGSTVETS